VSRRILREILQWLEIVVESSLRHLCGTVNIVFSYTSRTACPQVDPLHFYPLEY